MEVGKTWVSRNNNPPDPCQSIASHFPMGRTNDKTFIFSTIFLGGPMGPLTPWFGPLLLSTHGEAIGICESWQGGQLNSPQKRFLMTIIDTFDQYVHLMDVYIPIPPPLEMILSHTSPAFLI